MTTTEYSTSEHVQRKYCAVPFNEKEEFQKAAEKADLLFGYDSSVNAWFLQIPDTASLDGMLRWMGSSSNEFNGQNPTVDTGTVIRVFGEHLESLGLILDRPPQMDGQIHRTPVETGKAGSRDGAYCGYLDGHPAGWAENHKTGDKSTWKFNGHINYKQQTPEQRQAWAIKKQQIQKETERDQKSALGQLSVFFSNALTNKATKHPYLTKKQLYSCDPAIVVDDYARLVIPLVDIRGRLKSAQLITTRGNKKYAKDTLKQGAFFVAAPDGREFRDFWNDGEKASHIFIAEGYSTGLTICQAMDSYVVIAFDSANLKPVAQAIKDRFPEPQIVICADNDAQLINGNKGVVFAERAAENVGATVVIPEFEKPENGTDYNDLFCGNGGGDEGLTLVRQQIRKSLNIEKESTIEN